MTSRFAKNFKFNRQGQVRYLEVNQDGQPFQGQVPLTYQVYSGNGNTTVKYDGSDVFVLDSTLSDGALTVDFSDMQDWYGRSTQFIAYRTLLNDCNLDFGTGDLYFPPFTGSSHVVTLNPASSPAVTQWTYINPTTAVVNYNPTVSPGRIIPGGPGQVLTTDANTGTVQWEDPKPVAPKVLTFHWSTDAGNDLNSNTAQPISWLVDNTKNNTTLTLGGGTVPGTCQTFTVVDPGPYTIADTEFIISDPSIAYRRFIAINSDIWAFGESSLGLTGQTTSGSLTIDLVQNDVIAVYIGNATGTVTPVTPLDANYGTLSIIQHVY